MEHLPQTLIYGTLGGTYEQGRKRNITYGGYHATIKLYRDGKKESWVLTSYGPNDKKEGSP